MYQKILSIEKKKNQTDTDQRWVDVYERASVIRSDNNVKHPLISRKSISIIAAMSNIIDHQ